MSEDPTTTPAPSDTPTAAGTADAEHVTIPVVVPADGLASFYKSVADWWERYEADVRGRAMR